MHHLHTYLPTYLRCLWCFCCDVTKLEEVLKWYDLSLPAKSVDIHPGGPALNSCMAEYSVMLIHVSVVRNKTIVSQISARQWNLSIKDTLGKGHLSNEDTVCSSNHIELCVYLPLN